MESDSLNPEADPAASSTPPAPKVEPVPIAFTFTGKAGEFFRIWIVNMLLTIVTIGFYWPWATVRTRRYFYANTQLDGHAFDYLAKPLSLLIGYVLVQIVVITFYAMPYFMSSSPEMLILILYGSIFAGYILFFPWLVYKTLRFRAKNTMYRNVRFKFGGSLGDSYITFAAWAFLVPLTFGLIIPYWEMRKKEYALSNLLFGKTQFGFKPQAGEYYKYYLIFMAIGMAVYIVFTIVIFVLIAFAGFGASELGGTGEIFISILIAVVFAIGYAALIAALIAIQKGIWLYIYNYNLSVLSLGPLRFESRMVFKEYVLLAIGNMFATLFSLGLLYPWAKVRITKYQLENALVIAPGGDLGEYFEAEIEEEGALGEAATDVFDFDIGL